MAYGKPIEKITPKAELVETVVAKAPKEPKAEKKSEKKAKK